MTPRRLACLFSLLVALACALTAASHASEQGGATSFADPSPAAQQETAYPPPVPGNDGATLFRERGCTQCHQIQGAGGHRGPDLSSVGRRLKTSAIKHQILAGGGAMPAFGQALPPVEIKALTAYLHKQRAKAPHA